MKPIVNIITYFDGESYSDSICDFIIPANNKVIYFGLTYMIRSVTYGDSIGNITYIFTNASKHNNMEITKEQAALIIYSLELQEQIEGELDQPNKELLTLLQEQFNL